MFNDFYGTYAEDVSNLFGIKACVAVCLLCMPVSACLECVVSSSVLCVCV